MRRSKYLILVGKNDPIPDEVLGGRDRSLIQALVTDEHVYLILENLAPGTIWPVMMHEIGVHMGLRNTIGNTAVNQIAARIRALAANGSPTALRSLARLDFAGRTNEGDVYHRWPQVKDEDLIGFFIEEAHPDKASVGLIRKMIAKVRAWLFQRFGLAANQLSEAEILLLVRGATRAFADALPVPPGVVRTPAETKSLKQAPRGAAPGIDLRKVHEEHRTVPEPPDPSDMAVLASNIDLGDGFIADTGGAPDNLAQADIKRFGYAREAALQQGATPQEADAQAYTTVMGGPAPVPIELRKQQSLVDQVGSRIRKFIRNWIDGQTDIMQLMRDVEDRLGKPIDEGANWMAATVLSTDAYGPAERYYETVHAPAIADLYRQIIERLRAAGITSSGPYGLGEDKWTLDAVQKQVSLYREAKYVLELNAAHRMFHAPWNAEFGRRRKTVVEQYMNGLIDGATARRQIEDLFNQFLDSIGPDAEVKWLQNNASAGAQTDQEAQNILANAPAYQAAPELFQQADQLLSTLVEQANAVRAKAGIVDAALLDLYGFKHYTPLRTNPEDETTASVIHRELDQSSATGLQKFRLARQSPTAKWDTRAADNVERFFFDAHLEVAQNAVTAGMKQFADTYGHSVGDLVRIEKGQPIPVYRITDDGRISVTEEARQAMKQKERGVFYARVGGVLIPLTLADANIRHSQAIRAAWGLGNPVDSRPDGLSNALLGAARLRASFLTRFNPYFWMRALLRDPQNYTVQLANRYGTSTGAQFAAEFARETATKGVVGAMATSAMDIIRIDRGHDPKTEYGRLYKELLDIGGVSTRTRFVSSLARENAVVRDYKASGVRNNARKLVEYLDAISATTEVIARVAAYKVLLERGIPKTQAAQESKALLNFSARGQNKILQPGGLINFFVLFLRPTLVGSLAYLESFQVAAKRNPAMAAAHGFILVASGYVLTQLILAAMDDDDKRKWLALSPEKFMRKIPVPGVAFNDRNILAFPLGYGPNSLVGLGQLIARSAYTGEDSKMLADIWFTESVNALSPLEIGGNFLDSLLALSSAQTLDFMSQLANNKNHWGGRIYRELKGKSPSESAKPDTAAGWVELSRWLESIGLANDYTKPESLAFATRNMIPVLKDIVDVASGTDKKDGLRGLLGKLSGVSGPAGMPYIGHYKYAHDVMDEMRADLAHLKQVGWPALDSQQRRDFMHLNGLVKRADALESQIRSVWRERSKLGDKLKPRGGPKPDAIKRKEQRLAALQKRYYEMVVGPLEEN